MKREEPHCGRVMSLYLNSDNKNVIWDFQKQGYIGNNYDHTID
jgi:NifU-like protein involved in Fe-S cluster formation